MKGATSPSFDMNADPIRDLAQLQDMLSEPTDAVIDTMRRLQGDMIILGVGGKMGPTLARMAKRASDLAGVRRRVIGVARFTSTDVPSQLEAHSIEAIRCDLLDPAQLDALPETPNVVYMAGHKFGSTGNESLTWAMNSYLPGPVSQKFRHSRIVAFSTGNVYPLTPVNRGGSRETDLPAPVGEYAMSCLGRERTFEYFSNMLGIPLALIRLYYATEMRYGVLVDMAQKVWRGETIDLTMGHFNCIWQGDANAMSLCAFDHVASPPFVVNVVGPELMSVRRVGEEFGRLMNREPQFTGTEAPDALLGNAEKYQKYFGRPCVSPEQMLRWTADWVMRGGETLGKPTHFEARDGKY